MIDRQSWLQLAAMNAARVTGCTGLEVGEDGGARTRERNIQK